MNFFNKYKVYIIGLILFTIQIAGIITYVELTSRSKANVIVKAENEKIDSLHKIIKKVNYSIDSIAKNIKKTEYIINVKENNYKKIIENYEKDSVAIANYDADSINSFIARELKKRRR